MSTLVLLLAMVTGLAGTYVVWTYPRYFPVFLLVTGLFYFGYGPSIAGMRLSAVWLAVLIVLGLQALLSLPWLRLSGPEKLYALFLGWCAFEALRAESAVFALRLFLKLLYPFLVMVLARRAMLSGDEFWRGVKWILGASFAASLLVGGFTQRFLPLLCWRVGARFLWACAAFADHASLAVVLALVAWHMFGERKYLALAGWFGISSVLVGIRTGILASAVGAGVFILVSFKKHVAIPVLVALYLAAAASLFWVPHVKEYMFHDADAVDSREVILRPDQLPVDRVATHGRFAMWDEVLDRFFKPDPVMGSGLGATQAWFYSGAYGRARVEHSSYVRLLADTGIVGLSLFVGVMLSCMFAAWRIYRADPTSEAASCALCVLCAFPALMVCMAFDNLLNYVLPATQYPFAFTGLAAGLAERSVAGDRLLQADHMAANPAG